MPHFVPPLERMPVAGKNAPIASDLRTGDLLFPRRTRAPALSVLAGSRWAKQMEAMEAGGPFDRTIRELLSTVDERLPSLYAAPLQEFGGENRLHGYAPDPSRQSRQWLNSTVVSFESLLSQAVVPPAVESTSIPGPDDPDFYVAMMKILQLTMGDLVQDWLNMTLRQFIRSEIGQFLINALTSPDVSTSFFVGHVALVLREHDGESVESGGQLYVIEANATDFAHYRVALHAYHDPKDPDLAAMDPGAAVTARYSLRGWLNVRCSAGERVWHARPKLLGNDWQTPLLQACKRFLGRPYGFFDNPDFGDHNRFYCSEFVVRAYREVLPTYADTLCDRQTWSGMLKYLGASGQTDQRDLLQRVKSRYGIADSKPFFVLPPALLWNSAAILRMANPGWESEPYAESF